MTLRGAVLLLLSLCVAPITCFAGENEPLRAPYVEVGDCWSYHASNYSNRGPIDYYTICVTFIDRQNDVILAVATIKHDGREIDTSFTLEWSPKTTLAGVIFNPPPRVFKFPMQVGDVYSTGWVEFHEDTNASVAGKGKTDVNVVGWEDITVPAGTFRAMRIDGNTFSQLSDRPTSTTSTFTYWYAPEVSRWVKFVLTSQFAKFTRSEELTGFNLKK